MNPIQEIAKTYVEMRINEAKKLDPVNKSALKKDFDKRDDKDIDNDGDVDDSDEYLHNRRKAVSKATIDEVGEPSSPLTKSFKKMHTVDTDDTVSKGQADAVAAGKASPKPSPRKGDNHMVGDRKKVAESVELDEARGSDKPFFGTADGFHYAVNISGIDNDFPTKGFSGQVAVRREIVSFLQGTKPAFVGAKGKPTLAAVKKWAKENPNVQFYAKWKADSSTYKDDSVEVRYKKVKSAMDLDEAKDMTVDQVKKLIASGKWEAESDIKPYSTAILVSTSSNKKMAVNVRESFEMFLNKL